VTDDIVASAPPHLPLRGSHAEERRDEASDFAAIWNGILHEFRNHLTVLLASATEMRAALPPTLAVDVAAAVTEAERNVQSLSALLTQLDAAMSAGETLISDLDEMLERALRIAAPSFGRGISISVTKGRKAGVKNRGAALECLLSALLADVARVAEAKPGETRRPELSVDVDVGRSMLTVEIASNGSRPSPGSWRLALASQLASRLDATIGPHPEVAGYVVQFR
jgi:hypothetical protein